MAPTDAEPVMRSAVARHSAMPILAACRHGAFRPPIPVLPLQIQEKTMRKVVFLTAVAVILLLAAGALSQVSPTAAERRARDAQNVDIGALSRTIELNSLPTQELSPDTYR
jgi:hypothetical protein